MTIQTDPPYPADPRALRWFGWLMTSIAVSAFLGMTTATLLGVAARYLGVRGLEWTFEMSGILFLWTSFAGVVVAELRRENVAFTVLVQGLGRRGRRIVALVGSALTLWLAVEMLRSGIAFAGRSGMAPTAVLRLPRLVQIAPLVVFAAGVALIVVARIVQDLRAGDAR
ncbi:TRAP transporter small permease subunit [Aureimonas flava]|uniref:TRAP transporter small permease protein n=1 Tax=Aureimonas flava TaxID=2320271 RepID=A0A3A1WKX8_9HYPH|nr:TRAP transporter small permease subunit [Aureimonas flava]RIY01422.1 TRAP transporter small permease subunit [Aureimonas flava]